MLIALHKPYGVLSQFTPEPGSKWRTLAEFKLPSNVYALGRLDADSEGLLLLSDEPGLNSRLLDPAHAHRREYWAQVEGIPTADALTRLERGGIVIDEYKTLPCQAHLLDPATTSRDLPATCVSPARPSFPLTASDRSRSCLNPTGARGGGRTHKTFVGRF